MGVPQRTERVFFICLRKDLANKFLYYKDMFTEIPKIEMEFNEEEILFEQIFIENNKDRLLTEFSKEIWNLRKFGDIGFEDINLREFNKPNLHFNKKFIYKNKVANTITGKDDCVLFDEPRHKSNLENILCGSFPQDYNFLKVKPHYLIGMSVPPVVMAQISTKIYDQWLQYLK